MDENVRPDDMERITTPELAQAFIDEQVAAIREQVGDRTDVVNLNLLGHNDNAARVLTRGTAHTGAARREAVLLRTGALDAALLHVFFDVTERGFFGNRADGARSEHMVVSEDLAGVPVDA